MMKEQFRVAEWMAKFGQDYPPIDSNIIPSLEIRKLRAKLILEEALETIAGLGFEISIDAAYGKQPVITVNSSLTYEDNLKPNLIEIADGIADSLVVLLGTAIACGIDIEPVFEEVMRSNDSKLWTHDECLTAPSDYNYTCVDKSKIGTDRCYLVKDRMGKVIKSPSYLPAKILL